MDQGQHEIMMKQSCRLLFAITILCLSTGLTAQPQAGKKSQCSYTQVTSGLGYPEFEKGRTDFAIDDINMDGHPDLLSIGDHGSPNFNSDQHGIMVWFGDGQGNFSNHMNGNFGYGGIAVGDVNNDGLKDVGYGMHHNYSGSSFGDQLIEVALGDGSGMNWTPWDEGLATNGESWGMFGTAFADFNNNGYLDLVSTAFGCCAGIHVYLNQTDGSWVQSYGFLGGNSGMIVRACDIDNDGNMDFIANHQSGAAYFGDGNGGFVIRDAGLPANASLIGFDIGDVNNNGSTGLSYVNSGGGIEVYDWNRESMKWDHYSGNLPATGPYQVTQLFDMNSDGFTDVLAYGKQQFQLWLGDGAGNWTADAGFTIAGDPGNGRVIRTGGDFDNNGFPDLVILNQELSGGWVQFEQNKLYVFFEDTEADSLSIMAHHPVGHEKFHAGSVRFIEWISAVPGNAPSAAGIDISASGPAGPWTTIAEDLPNNGRHQWTVTNIDSEDCFLRLRVTSAGNTASSITQHAFTIIGGPVSLNPLPAADDATVSLLPNPGKDHVLLSSNREIMMIAMYDMSGKKLMETENPGKRLFTGALPSGFYFYRVLLESGEVRSGKWLRK